MKRSRKVKVMSPEEIAGSARPSIMERLAELYHLPSVTARIRRLGGGNDLAGGVYPIEFMEPPDFDRVIYANHGGGQYEMRFHVGNRPLLLSNGQLETYIFSIAGEPKTKPSEIEQMSEQEHLRSMREFLLEVIKCYYQKGDS